MCVRDSKRADNGWCITHTDTLIYIMRLESEFDQVIWGNDSSEIFVLCFILVLSSWVVERLLISAHYSEPQSSIKVYLPSPTFTYLSHITASTVCKFFVYPLCVCMSTQWCDFRIHPVFSLCIGGFLQVLCLPPLAQKRLLWSDWYL